TRRGILESIPHHAEGLRASGTRPRLVGDAFRKPDLATNLATSYRLRRGAARGARPRQDGAHRHPREGAKPGSGARGHRFRRVLRLFQLLPDGVGATVDRAVLPAGHRTAQTRDRYAARAGLFGIQNPYGFSARRGSACTGRCGGGHGRGAGVWRTDPAGPADLVVRRRWHAAALAARFRRGAWRSGTRRCAGGPGFGGLDLARTSAGNSTSTARRHAKN